jgi:hypothetical protein
MSMIFGHAIIVVPVFTSLSFPYHAVMWLPLVFLHGSLLFRAYGDATFSFEIKEWGGMLNAVALGLFAAVALVTVLRANVGTGSSEG